VVEKGFFNLNNFIKAVKAKEQYAMIVHCRVASKGEIGMANCHPFQFDCTDHPEFSFVVAHNGTLPWRSTKEKSDTRCFTEDILAVHLNRDPWFLDDWIGMMFLERLIGLNNKLVIMRYDSEKNEYTTYIVNKKEGNESHGCWFSNYSWRRWGGVHHAAWTGSAGWMGKDGLNGWSQDPVTKMWKKDKVVPFAQRHDDKIEHKGDSVAKQIELLENRENGIVTGSGMIGAPK